jgi:hypothetical protein
MTKNGKHRRGVATIIGSILSIVILLFFFSNVFLWSNSVNQQMNLVMADKLHSQIALATTVLEGTSYNCTDDPTFGGFGSRQLGEYGTIQSGSFSDTNETDGNYQILREDSYYIQQYYIALNATYSFTVDKQEANTSRALTFSLFGKYVDDNERCEVYIWNVKSQILEFTGITINTVETWYNVTLVNPQRFMSSSGAVNITYLSDRNELNQSVNPENPGLLSIDAHQVTLSPVGLTARSVGGRDVRLLRLWVIEEPVNIHRYFDFDDMFGAERWVPGGSALTIVFGNVNQTLPDTIILDYSPTLGEVRFRLLTELGNTAMTTYE